VTSNIVCLPLVMNILVTRRGLCSSPIMLPVTDKLSSDGQHSMLAIGNEYTSDKKRIMLVAGNVTSDSISVTGGLPITGKQKGPVTCRPFTTTELLTAAKLLVTGKNKPVTDTITSDRRVNDCHWCKILVTDNINASH
jgi:hypothetical protein